MTDEKKLVSIDIDIPYPTGNITNNDDKET